MPAIRWRRRVPFRRRSRRRSERDPHCGWAPAMSVFIISRSVEAVVSPAGIVLAGWTPAPPDRSDDDGRTGLLPCAPWAQGRRCTVSCDSLAVHPDNRSRKNRRPPCALGCGSSSCWLCGGSFPPKLRLSRLCRPPRRSRPRRRSSAARRCTGRGASPIRAPPSRTTRPPCSSTPSSPPRTCGGPRPSSAWASSPAPFPTSTKPCSNCLRTRPCIRCAGWPTCGWERRRGRSGNGTRRCG